MGLSAKLFNTVPVIYTVNNGSGHKMNENISETGPLQKHIKKTKKPSTLKTFYKETRILTLQSNLPWKQSPWDQKKLIPSDKQI